MGAVAPLLLCATSRLAQTLREAVPAGARAWRTPRALTPAQWLAALAEEAALRGLTVPDALTPYAERLLWESLIADTLDAASAPLFDVGGLALAAADAHALTQVWGIAPGGPFMAEETRQFLAWQKAFIKRCQAAGWSDTATQQRAVIAHLEAGAFALPENITFVGFDRHTPLEQRLIAALQARGCTVQGEAPRAPAAQVSTGAYADARAECAAAAAWVRARLNEAPGARLGIVAPDLAGVRDTLAVLLDDALHPGAASPAMGEAPRRFNISLGRPLADIPLVATGLALLRLVAQRKKVEQATLSRLLLGHGWSASESEADERARLDAAMRRDLPALLRPGALLRLGERLAEAGTLACPATLAALNALLAGQQALPGKRLRPGEWAIHCRRLLVAAGWPGERPLSSHEYQAHLAFLGVIDSLATLDPLLGQISFADALFRLAQLARERIFQPETRGEPQVHVLGVLESTGLQFDALWVMGMTDDQWPPSPRPNPLLPAELQRAARSPHASADVEHDFARHVHERLLAAAPEVRFSWSEHDGNRLLRASPLIAQLPRRELDLEPVTDLASRLAAASREAIERLSDHQAPPVQDGEKVRGGSWLLRAQAICPAWGFYQYRLGAEALKTAVEGLDPAARGTLVHAALEHFWQATGDSDALAAGRDSTRPAVVTSAVEAALSGYEAEHHAPFPARFRALEHSRLCRLLLAWLALEDERPGAFRVIACEAPAEVDIEGIRVRMVVDRIDRLEDGRTIIIDYKTGRAIDVKNWAEDRLTEPQLPIYAALVADDTCAVTFAKVLADAPAFNGVAADAGLLPGVLGLGEKKQKTFDAERFPDWPAVIAHWHARLHAIAREVREGDAAVRPSDESKLLYCEVLPLLRLPERLADMRAALAAPTP